MGSTNNEPGGIIVNMYSLIGKNLKKNLKNYYLYIFALTFGVSLFFAFATLQYDPSMDATNGSIKGGAAIQVASFMLIAIIGVFLIYANAIFIKRRSKEIGLLQLIGMSKKRIVFLMSAENFLLYAVATVLGIGVGFAFSKLITSILFKAVGITAVAKLHFSMAAMERTLIVFSVIFLMILLINAAFIKKQSILSLFKVKSASEMNVKKQSVWEILMGILGLGLVSSGYFVSTKLFGGYFTSTVELMGAMMFILGSVIIGTYFFYKGSVSFVFNVIRKQRKGYLNVREVLSLSSIMFRMKTNSMLLTIITTVSALAIGLLSLTYISYYSTEASAKKQLPDDFTFLKEDGLNQFEKALGDNHIDYSENRIDVLQVAVDLEGIVSGKVDGIAMDLSKAQMAVISADDAGLKLNEDEAILTGYSDMLKNFMPMKEKGEIVLQNKETKQPLDLIKTKDDHYISWKFTGGGFPVVIVNDTVFQTMKEHLDPGLQGTSNANLGVNIKDDRQLEKANDLYVSLFGKEENLSDSRPIYIEYQKANMGISVFIVGFLGLTFLITSGCILYFKQMDESEEERPNYTILRKLGYSRHDLQKGIRFKQLFNFGIPLAVGLLHSYFAVKSGWFWFGSELWTPLLIVMGLYTVLYSAFGVLSTLYSRRIIRESL